MSGERRVNHLHGLGDLIVCSFDVGVDCYVDTFRLVTEGFGLSGVERAAV